MLDRNSGKPAVTSNLWPNFGGKTNRLLLNNRYDSDNSDWEGSAYDAFNEMDEQETKVFSLKISTVLYTVYNSTL